MIVNLPLRFKNKLEEDESRKYSGFVYNILNYYQIIVGNSKLEFFPEYTDHGINHLNEVVVSADNLIPEESFNLLTYKDVAILIYAIILHDLGMHLNSEIFLKLIQQDDITLPFFDKKSWNKLWHEYLKSANKFTDLKKINIFGTKDIVIKEPDFFNLSEIDKRLIGEFIRIHHHRIAHEMAIDGYALYTKESYDDKKYIDNIDKPFRDLGGLIARSHGINLRDTFEYLKINYSSSWKNPYDIKVVYLMAILRIADYIQIHKERAPEIILNIQRFISPYSKKEWNLHNSIEFINISTDDPEMIYVHALPKNCSSFLKLKELFTNIQNEIDITWAVLGEVYGNWKGHFKITIRRLKSNIDDLDNFKNQINYIPTEIKFKADPSVLKLLVKPLYNNNPSMGVRELIQNSIDACNERKTIEKGYTPSIKLKLESEGSVFFLTIEDNGIGMNEDVLVNYYFQAGSSFRYSKEWIENNENNLKSQRVGKFGIGVLATFLLGKVLHLETRHYLSNYGLMISTEFDSEIIEVNKSSKIRDVGTKIKIELNTEISQMLNIAIEEKKYDIFDWFMWYIKDNNFISFEIEESLIKLFRFPTHKEIEPENPSDNPLWATTNLKGYTDICWTFIDKDYNSLQTHGARGVLSCNGILIKNGYYMKYSGYNWAYPRVSIHDKDGIFPLSLDRNSIYENRLPFEKEFIIQICKDLLVKLLSIEFSSCGDFKYLDKVSSEMPYVCKSNLCHHIICGEKGYIINMSSIFEKLKIDRIWSFWLRSNKFEIGYRDFFKKKNQYYRIFRVNSILNQIEINDKTYAVLIDDKKNLSNWFAPVSTPLYKKITNRNYILFAQNHLKEYLSKESIVDIEDLNIHFPSLRVKPDESDYRKYTLEDFGDRINLKNIQHNEIFDMIYYSVFYNGYNPNEFTIFREIVFKYLNEDFIIPFNYEERKEKYKMAFTELSNYVERNRRYFTGG